MKKSLIYFCLLSVLVLVISGCSGKENDKNDSDSQSKIQKQQSQNQIKKEVWEADPDEIETAVQAIPMESSIDNDKIPESVLEGKKRNTAIYSLDINRDGIKEYVITYLVGESDNMSSMTVYNPEDHMQKVIFDQSDTDVTFTASQKNQINTIINTWYEDSFQNSRNLAREDFEKYHIVSFSCYPVEYDEKTMIHVSFQLSEQKNQSFLKDDTIEAVLDWDGKEYNVYKCWYKGKYKSTIKFGM